MKNLFSKFPCPLKHLLNSPAITREYLHNISRSSISYPSIAGIKKLCLFYGFSDDAIRSHLSRGRRAGDFNIYKKGKRKVFELSKNSLSVSGYYQNRTTKTQYILILFSFPTEEAKQRYILKEYLKNLYFTMINPSAYIGYGQDKEMISNYLTKEGYSNYVLMFPDITILPEIALKRIKENSNLTMWNNNVELFSSKKDNFLKIHPPGSSTRLFALLGISVSLYSNIIMAAPNLPDNIFKARLLISKIEQELFDLNKREADFLEKEYVRIFG